MPTLSLGEPDPELLALPAPPKRERALTVIVMAVTSLAALALAWALLSEARYAVSTSAPVDLGALVDAQPDASMANRYVRGEGLLGTHGAIRYGRAAESDSFRLVPIAGNDRIWVEIRVPEGFEGPRFIPPTLMAGRLVPFDRVGLRHSSLRAAVEKETGVRVPDGAWILIDGSSPRAARWALGLVVLFALFGVYNIVGIFRILRKVRDDGGRQAT